MLPWLLHPALSLAVHFSPIGSLRIGKNKMLNLVKWTELFNNIQSVTQSVCSLVSSDSEKKGMAVPQMVVIVLATKYQRKRPFSILDRGLDNI